MPLSFPPAWERSLAALVTSSALLAGAALAGTASAQTALPGSVAPVVPCPPPAPRVAIANPAAPAIPSPAPGGSAPLSAAPLAIAGAALQLNVGMCARLFVSGGTGPYAALSTLGDVAVTAEPGATFLSKGLRNGYDTVTITDARGATIRVPVLVAPDAGVLPASLALQLAGRPPPTSAGIGTQFSTPAGGTSVMVGSWAIPPIVGKRYLIGDYGVVRPLRITLTNVSSAAQAVYMYETPSPNGVTTTLFFDGDAAPLELPCLQAPANAPQRYLIRKINVPPGGSPG